MTYDISYFLVHKTNNQTSASYQYLLGCFLLEPFFVLYSLLLLELESFFLLFDLLFLASDSLFFLLLLLQKHCFLFGLPACLGGGFLVGLCLVGLLVQAFAALVGFIASDGIVAAFLLIGRTGSSSGSSLTEYKSE